MYSSVIKLWQQGMYRPSGLAALGSDQLGHRVKRVIGFLSSRQNWVPPPSPASECCSPSVRFQEGRHTSLPGRGWGGTNSDEGTGTLILYVYYIV